MSTPFTHCRFSASFVTPISEHATKRRTFKGTMKVAEGTTDLAAVVVGTISAIAIDEKLTDVQSIRITASVVRKRK